MLITVLVTIDFVQAKKIT